MNCLTIFLSLGVKRSRPEAEHSPLTSADVKITQIYKSLNLSASME